MFGLDIALSGLRVSQQSLATVGTNMANAATEGYHRQTVRVSPVDTGNGAAQSMGGAVVTGVSRAVDSLLENEILRQRPLQGQLEQELSALQSAEGALGSLDTGGLWTTLQDFFSSLSQLAGQSDSLPLQDQAVRAADSLAGEFRRIGAFFQGQDRQVEIQTQAYVGQINDLAVTIAQLNAQIQARSSAGENANVLKDQRDQAVADLSELVEVQVSGTDPLGASVDITAGGIPIVTGANALPLAAGWAEGGQLGLGAAGSSHLLTSLGGGKIGGLLSLTNDLLATVRSDLGALAGSIASSVNRLHVQGVGSAGSFTELAGEPVPDTLLGTWGAGITAGTFYVRVLDDAGGTVARSAVSVNPATDDIGDIAARLDAISGLSASVANGVLHIQADAGHHFDFLPAVAAAPYTSTLSGTAAPTVSGLYTGPENQVYTCRVTGTGQVGLTGGLGLEVRNGAGELIRTLAVGSGYAAGDLLDLDSGLTVSLSAGTLTAGEEFTIQAMEQSDPTGVLAAAGINTLFSGNSMGTLAVRADVLADPRRLATAAGPGGTDNLTIRRLADLQTTPDDSLGNGLNPLEACERVVTNLGQVVAIRQARMDASDNLLTQLENQRDAASGVDLNLEAANMLSFQQMFQSMAKYISVLDQSMQTLMEVL